VLRVPPYFDFLIEGFRAGQGGRHVHLGYWDEPPPLSSPCSADEFAAAQARLTDLMVALADLRDGHHVLDVGCGFGGTLEAVSKAADARLCGVNIDRRQLDLCRSLPIPRARLALVLADACALPFRAESFERIFCVEAMFHFGSRARFLSQAAAALRPGGRLVLSDILLRQPPSSAPLGVAAIEAVLRKDYGPWPQPWIDQAALIAQAERAGLTLDRVVDLTRQTLPSYRYTAPRKPVAPWDKLSAGSVLRWLHSEGYLSYLCLVLRRR
jgi:cyclopropane fatty-acyl-phospholipid synthase-like methyltransferase